MCQGQAYVLPAFQPVRTTNIWLRTALQTTIPHVCRMCQSPHKQCDRESSIGTEQNITSSLKSMVDHVPWLGTGTSAHLLPFFAFDQRPGCKYSLDC